MHPIVKCFMSRTVFYSDVCMNGPPPLPKRLHVTVSELLRTSSIDSPSVSSWMRSGDKLCSVEDCIPGTGVYMRHGYIYSSLAGYVLRKNEGEEVRVVVGVCHARIKVFAQCSWMWQKQVCSPRSEMYVQCCIFYVKTQLCVTCVRIVFV